MQRIALLLPLGLTSGLLIGLIAGGLVLNLILGRDPNATGVLARLQDIESSCQSRRVLWANVVHLIAQKPLLGWGWGELDYAHFVTLYPGPRFCDILDNAHNLPLHLAVELGVPFALLVSALATWLILRQKPWRESDPIRQLAWAVLALIGLHSLLEYPLWYGPFQMAVVLAAWMLWQTSGVQSSQNPEKIMNQNSIFKTTLKSVLENMPNCKKK
jgi:O-antigen ligase